MARCLAWPTASAWKWVAAIDTTSFLIRSTRYSAATLYRIQLSANPSFMRQYGDVTGLASSECLEVSECHRKNIVLMCCTHRAATQHSTRQRIRRCQEADTCLGYTLALVKTGMDFPHNAVARQKGGFVHYRSGKAIIDVYGRQASSAPREA